MSSGDPAPYIKWQPGEPQRTSAETNIVMTVYRDSSHSMQGMEDIDPSTRIKGFVCQRQLYEEQETTTPVIQTATTTATAATTISESLTDSRKLCGNLIKRIKAKYFESVHGDYLYLE